MKKLLSVILALVVLFAVQAPALADLGEPQFENWYVVCGLEGWDFSDEGYDEQTKNYVTVHDHLEPGTRLMVFDFNEQEKEYLLVADDDNFKPKGKGFVYVTENELGKYFFEYKKSVPGDRGQKLDEEVKCVVTSSDGVVLRQGPARTFPSYTVVPNNAEITYRYTYSYGGYNWGYTTYKGQTGWMCIDYTKAADETIRPEPEPTVTETPETDTTEPATTETAADLAEPPVSQDAAAQTETATQSQTLMSETSYIIVICCLCAVVVALSATVILMILKRKRVK